MFNPFAIFEPRYLYGFQKKGVQAFVMQTYNRGRRPFDTRPAYLLTHFNKLDWAREHYDVLQHDPNRKIFRFEEPGELSALKTAIGGHDALYYTILTVHDANKKAKKTLEKQIRSFIERTTTWRPNGDDEVSLDLDIRFGEIFVKLFFKNHQVKERLDRLDSPKHYVL